MDGNTLKNRENMCSEQIWNKNINMITYYIKLYKNDNILGCFIPGMHVSLNIINSICVTHHVNEIKEKSMVN